MAVNSFDIKLNIDKSQKSVIPPLIHRVADLAGLTIKATILQKNQLAPIVITKSPILICDFDNGDSISVTGKASSGSKVSVSLNDSFQGHLGRAICYFKFSDGTTTQNFPIIFIESIHYTDEDLTWNNSNFDGKISDDLNSNPNVIGRSLVDYDLYPEILNGSSWPVTRKVIASDIFKSKFDEAKQQNYDALTNGFYDDAGGNNYIMDNSLIDKPESDIRASGANSGLKKSELQPVFARFKVPSSTRKIRINNMLGIRDMLEFVDEKKGVRALPNLNSSYLYPYIVIYSDDVNGEFVRLTNESRYVYWGTSLDRKNAYLGLKDLSGVNIISWSKDDTNKTRVRSVEIDTLKNHVIDKDGYINIVQDFRGQLSGDVPTGYYLNFITYPQINIDYGYLDLS